MNVIVLDGTENQAVAATRSLSRAGHRVTVGAATTWSKAGWSRASAGTFLYPSPNADGEGFVAAVLAEVGRQERPLVLPMTERTTLPLSAMRDRVQAAGGRMVLPAHDIVLRAFDKQQTVSLASSLGIRVPRTIVLTSMEQARSIAPSLPYPVVLKPSASEERTATGTRTTGQPLYACDADGLIAAYARIGQRAATVLVQEFVEGTGVGYFALMHHGELRAEFAHQRLRDVRPTGSGSSLRVSTTPSPELRESALAILTALEWHGVAMVEFRQPENAPPVFLEVNGRFWNSLALAVHAGADFPSWIAEMADRGDVRPSPGYDVGVRCRWMLGDVRHLIEVFRGAPRGFPGRFPRRLDTLRSFLTPMAGTRHDNFSWRDPLPEVGDWVDFIGRRVPALVQGRRA